MIAEIKTPVVCRTAVLIDYQIKREVATKLSECRCSAVRNDVLNDPEIFPVAGCQEVPVFFGISPSMVQFEIVTWRVGKCILLILNRKQIDSVCPDLPGEFRKNFDCILQTAEIRDSASGCTAWMTTEQNQVMKISWPVSRRCITVFPKPPGWHCFQCIGETVFCQNKICPGNFLCNLFFQISGGIDSLQYRWGVTDALEFGATAVTSPFGNKHRGKTVEFRQQNSKTIIGVTECGVANLA